MRAKTNPARRNVRESERGGRGAWAIERCNSARSKVRSNAENAKRERGGERMIMSVRLLHAVCSPEIEQRRREKVKAQKKKTHLTRHPNRNSF